MEQPAAGRPSRPRTRDLILAALFTVGWLLPVAVSSWRGGPPSSWPTRARDFYSVSCLFGTASDRVSMFYVQVRREGLAGWQDFDEGEYFRLEPFGHRTRFDRFMARFGVGDSGEQAREELAHWLAARDRERQPGSAPIIAVRFLWTDRHIDAEDPPQGCWRKPPRAELGAVPMRRLGSIVVIAPAEGGP
ncbi:MAG: hypothetical protein KC457_01900 [Myxococcales bacterium]|nr:hypothetical protein [Myxococcales bacterium]